MWASGVAQVGALCVSAQPAAVIVVEGAGSITIAHAGDDVLGVLKVANPAFNETELAAQDAAAALIADATMMTAIVNSFEVAPDFQKRKA